MFLAGSQGLSLQVLALDPTTGTLTPWGSALSAEQLSSSYPERISFVYVFPAADGQTVVISLRHKDHHRLHTFGGDGGPWHHLGDVSEHPRLSVDGKLVWLWAGKQNNRVRRWDGKLVGTIGEGNFVGFTRASQGWVTSVPDSETLIVHDLNGKSRKVTPKHWDQFVFRPRIRLPEEIAPKGMAGWKAHGSANGEFWLAVGRSEVLALKREDGAIVARYPVVVAEGATGAISYVHRYWMSGPEVMALLSIVYTGPGCGDVPCGKGSDIVLWRFDATGASETQLLNKRFERIGNSTFDSTGRYLVWHDDTSVHVFDIESDTHRTIATDYQLALIQSQPR